MFDTFYDFLFLQTNTCSIGKDMYKEHKFAFDGKGGQRYIINVEEYNYSVYAIKFFLKNHSNSVNKYKIKTNLFEAPPVIRTCINVMKYFLNKDPYASFGFIGSREDSELENSASKRFRVYKFAVNNLISPVAFLHYEKPDKDLYLILNKLSEEKLPQIELMFHNYYPALATGSDL